MVSLHQPRSAGVVNVDMGETCSEGDFTTVLQSARDTNGHSWGISIHKFPATTLCLLYVTSQHVYNRKRVGFAPTWRRDTKVKHDLSPGSRHHPTIGHSEKSPCPNLKKLGEPASTTAMMATFFPCLIAAIGCGRLSGVGCVACCVVWLWNGHSENHEIEANGAEVVTLPPAPGVLVLMSFPVVFSWDWFAGGFRRTRGTGGGTSGNTSKSAVSSVKEGMQVVLALPLNKHEDCGWFWRVWLPDNRNREIWNRRVGFLVRRVRLIYIEEVRIRRLGRRTRCFGFQRYTVAVGDKTECPENGSCGGGQSCPIQQHVRRTVVHVYPQQGTGSDRFPPIEGRSQEGGDTGKYESEWMKYHLYQGSSLNSADWQRVRRRHRV